MKTKKAFTLIELLVVIAIIGLLATLSVLALNNARMKARDTKRLADVKQMQTAMELYFNSTGHYPSVEEFNSGKFEHYSPSVGTSTYMIEIPSAPTPPDGSCSSADNTYTYIPNAELSDYELTFCVAKSSSDLPDGNLIGFSGGIKGGGTGGGGGTPAPECFDNFSSCSFVQFGPDITTDNIYYGAVGMNFVGGVPYIMHNSGNNGYVAVKSFNSGTNSWDEVAQISVCTSCTDGVSSYVTGNNIYVGISDYYGGNANTYTSVNSWGAPIVLGTRSAILAKNAPYAVTRISGAPGIKVKHFDGAAWENFFQPISSNWSDLPVNIIVDGSNIYVKYLDYSTGSYKPYFASFNSVLSSWDVYPVDNTETMNNDALFMYNGHPTLISDSNASAPFVRYFNGSSWAELGDIDVDVPACLHISYATVWNGSVFASCANSSWAYKMIKYNGTNWTDTNIPAMLGKLIVDSSDQNLYCYGNSNDSYRKVYKLELN